MCVIPEDRVSPLTAVAITLSPIPGYLRHTSLGHSNRHNVSPWNRHHAFSLCRAAGATKQIPTISPPKAVDTHFSCCLESYKFHINISRKAPALTFPTRVLFHKNLSKVRTPFLLVDLSINGHPIGLLLNQYRSQQNGKGTKATRAVLKKHTKSKRTVEKNEISKDKQSQILSFNVPQQTYCFDFWGQTECA